MQHLNYRWEVGQPYLLQNLVLLTNDRWYASSFLYIVVNTFLACFWYIIRVYGGFLKLSRDLFLAGVIENLQFSSFFVISPEIFVLKSFEYFFVIFLQARICRFVVSDINFHYRISGCPRKLAESFDFGSFWRFSSCPLWHKLST